MLTRKIEITEKKIDATEQALIQFSGAVSEYAKHLASHTSAIQSLAEASQELKKGAAEQNRVLTMIIDDVIINQRKQETPHPKEEVPPPTPPKPERPEVKLAHEMPDLRGKPLPPGCARGQYQKLTPHEILEKWKVRINQV